MLPFHSFDWAVTGRDSADWRQNLSKSQLGTLSCIQFSLYIHRAVLSSIFILVYGSSALLLFVLWLNQSGAIF